MEDLRNIGEEIRMLREEVVKLREDLRRWRLEEGRTKGKEKYKRDEERENGDASEEETEGKTKEKEEEENKEKGKREERREKIQKEEGQEEPEKKKEREWENRKEEKERVEENKERMRGVESCKMTKEAEERRERWIREEERRKNIRRGKSLVWKGVKGENIEERLKNIKVILKKELGEKAEIKSAVEREGEGGRAIVITEMEEEDNKKEMVWMRNGIWERWRVEVDEDLNKEERRLKWIIKEKAKKERDAGRKVMYNSRRIWVEGTEIKWNEEKKNWEKISLRERLERTMN
ncbi:vicilin-like seed storage protein At2g18540 [Osmia bicornis bicornis]|uniref:vicilin-like seed storage protein At2g18540 n=1 Tax=Osmia bicornis bicornis TaxID=1437191 RepID=UPI001EAE8DC3|nr:vicilin-like seed storage protein At2g18540 [Osmia bicornis bicornis]XP_046145603.1 vicilin-like seed storage protein At2g18540 [Osmia bicornis bicornis]